MVIVTCWEGTMMETRIGKVTHYYPKVGVAAVILGDHLAKGETIHIYGAHEDFHQTVTSMEYEHAPIEEAEEGQDIGIRVVHKVHVGDIVSKEI